ncbi:MAG: ATP-dependent Clp protease ATP-binding subunit [Candidatus Moranbacteria bacterium]|nr:ATP-dependent Clp protease ATP-binding subunit [Candidatus Moranbacteria bacterium]
MLNSNHHFFQKLTHHAKRSLVSAEEIAYHYNHQHVNTTHLLYAILAEEGSLGYTLLKNAGLTQEAFAKLLKNGKVGSKKNSNDHASRYFSPELRTVITKAYALANKLRYPYVGTEHLVCAAFSVSSPASREAFATSEMDAKEMKNILHAGLHGNTFSGFSRMFDLPDFQLSKDNDSTSSTPNLDQFATDMLESSSSSNPVVGRDTEIDRIAHILGRKEKNNPLLIGEPGVGKTALVSGLAHRIATGTAPVHLLGKRILMLDLALIVAGTNFRGEFESRLKDIIEEASEHPEIILFIDEIHTLSGAGNATGGLDAANILKPSLARGTVRCIGATTFSEYKSNIEKDAALARRFQSVIVSEPTPSEALVILRGTKESYEQHHGVVIDDSALVMAVDLSVRFITDRFLPDKALDLIDEAASFARSRDTRHAHHTHKLALLENTRQELHQKKHSLLSEEKFDHAVTTRAQADSLEQDIAILQKRVRDWQHKNRPHVLADDIATTLSRTTGIALSRISATFPLSFSSLERKLSSHVFGQKEVLSDVLDTILRSHSGFSHPGRPLGSFLFLGPSGVGKTLTAKTIAQELFGHDALIRVDMSELGERHSTARLIGAPAGYVGYGEGGALTESVRRKPYSVVLFDEFEKAHPDVLNLLLQILEEGSLSDGQGCRIDFTNTIIILTANIGTKEFNAHAQMGFDGKITTKKQSDNFRAIRSRVLAELKHSVRPEILNRLDHMSVFRPLTLPDVTRVVRQELKGLSDRVLKSHKTTLRFTSPVLRHLSKKSFSPQHGARSVRSQISTLVETPLARLLLSWDNGSVKKPSASPVVSVSLSGDQLVFIAKTK